MSRYIPEDDEAKTYAAGALVIAVSVTIAGWALWNYVTGLTVAQRVELAGAASGLLGAAMLAAKTARMGWGWVAFTVSNAVLIAFYWLQGHQFLLVMQVGFLITSLTGIYTWLIAPAWQRRRAATEGGQ